MNEPPAAFAPGMLDLLASNLRAVSYTRRDPTGARACRKLLINPMLEALDGNRRPPLAIEWPDSEAARAGMATEIRAHCRECGLCDKSKARFFGLGFVKGIGRQFYPLWGKRRDQL